jgi:hypothetical protein
MRDEERYARVREMANATSPSVTTARRARGAVRRGLGRLPGLPPRQRRWAPKAVLARRMGLMITGARRVSGRVMTARRRAKGMNQAAGCITAVSHKS